MTNGAEERAKLIVLAVVGLVLTIGVAVGLNRSEIALYRSDIFQRWYATEKLLSEGRDLYSDANGEEILDYPGVERYDGELTNFFYPAHLLIFTLPLALLPYPIAHIVWTTAVQLFYFLALLLAARLAGWPRTINGQTLLLGAALLFFPFLQHTIWGQFNTIGLLGLVLCVRDLRQGRLARAGIWAIALTIKPHMTVLTLLWLVGWAAARRERWRFFAGFVPAGLLGWLVAALWQPNWVFDFLGTLGGYVAVSSAVDRLANPLQLTALALVTVAAFVLIRGRHVDAGQPAFLALATVSVAAWYLVVPVAGMMHSVWLPVLAVWLVGVYRHVRPTWARRVTALLAALYLLGWLAFALGLSSGNHIAGAEAVYFIAAPLALFALGLLLTGEQYSLAERQTP